MVCAQNLKSGRLCDLGASHPLCVLAFCLYTLRSIHFLPIPALSCRGSCKLHFLVTVPLSTGLQPDLAKGRQQWEIGGCEKEIRVLLAVSLCWGLGLWKGLSPLGWDPWGVPCWGFPTSWSLGAWPPHWVCLLQGCNLLSLLIPTLPHHSNIFVTCAPY